MLIIIKKSYIFCEKLANNKWYFFKKISYEIKMFRISGKANNKCPKLMVKKIINK